MDVLILPVLTVLSLFAFTAITDAPSVYIDSITVAEPLEKAGFRPNVVIEHLFQRMREIEAGGFSREHGGERSSDYETTPVRALSEYLGTRTLIRTIQQNTGFVGITLTGDITLVRGVARFEMRGVGWRRPGFSLHEEMPVDDIDDLISHMALRVMRRTEPYQLVLYLFRNNFESGSFAEVEAIAKEAIDTGPADERHWFHNILGIVRAASGDGAGALEQFRIAVALAPEVGLQYSNIGMILASQGRHDEALGYFERCRQSPDTKPANAAVCSSEAGASLAALGREQDAVARFAEATRLDPSYADVYLHWAALLHRQGDQVGAARMLARARTLYPGQTVYTENLMQLVIRRAGGLEGRIGSDHPASQ